LLKVRSIKTSYGNIRALNGIDIEVNDREFVTIVGANGAGKSTLLYSLVGVLKIDEGAVEFLGEAIEREPPHARVRRGLVLVPEGRAILIRMTVFENLLTGGYSRKDQKRLKEEADAVMDHFPQLRAKSGHSASVLSGGEQQMLTIARALMAGPKLLMIDEPSLGLAPLMVKEVFNVIKDLRERGITILLVEQNAMQALQLADRGYVLEQGKIAAQDPADKLLRNLQKLEEAYFGIREI